MRKIIITCDVCGREITGKVYKICFGVAEADKITDDPCYQEIEKDTDFCAFCIDKVEEAIEHLVNPPALEEKEEPKPVEEPKEKKPRKKIDVGKVWALHDGNWGIADIAAELYCSTQTVRNILAKERPDMEVAVNEH